MKTEPSRFNGRSRRYRLVTLAASMAAVPLDSAVAANRFWSGSSDANLATATNWDTLPVSGDSWTFGAVGTAGSALTNNLASSSAFEVAGITFSSAATTSYTISSGSFSLTGNIVMAGGANNQTIGSNISISGARQLNLNSGGVAAGNLLLTGNLSGDGSLTQTAGNGGARSVSFSGDNSGFTGSFIQNNDGNNRTAFSAATAGSASAAWTFNRNVNGGVALNFANSTIDFGSLSGGGFIRANSNGTVNVSVGALGTNSTFSGIFQQAGGATLLSLTKVGSGTLTLSGASSHTAGTNLNAGAIQLNNASALGTTGTISFGGGTLRYGTVTTDLSARFSSAAGQAYRIDTNGNDVTFASSLNSTDGSLVKSGSGTLTLAAANGYAGVTQVNLGTLRLGHADALGTTAGISSVASGATLDLNGQTIAEQFGDTGSSDGFSGTGVGGTGALINSSTSAATITGDILGNAANGIAPGSNGFVVGGSGDIALLGRIDRRNNGVSGMGIQMIGSGTLTIGGTVSNGAFNNLWVDSGTAVLAKSGNAMAVANVTINGGTLKMDPNHLSTNTNAWQGQIGNSLIFEANGGTWDLNGTGGVNNRLKGVNGSTGTITNNGTAPALLNFAMRDNNASWSYSGTITDGTGTVAITTTNGGFGSGQVQTLGGNNSYSGGSTLTFGTLRMGHDNALGTGWVRNSATLDLNGHILGNELQNQGNGAVFTNGSATTATVSQGFNIAQASGVIISDFTVGGSSGDIHWSGDIYRSAGVGLITKNGSNSVNFAGDVNNMGLAVTGGTAEVSGSFDGGTVTISSGATLNVTSGGLFDATGSTTITGSFALLSGGSYRFDIGANGINEAIGGTGTAAFDGLFVFDLDLADLTDGNAWQIVDVANLTESFGTGFMVSGFIESADVWTRQVSGYEWTFRESTGQLSLAVVPEPDTAIIGGLALCMVLRRRRR